MKVLSQFILNNRLLFLSELRSGKYQKGTIKSDEHGKPIIVSEEDNNGYCCCAVMAHLFGQKPNGKLSLPQAIKALGITTKDCKFIQTQINDTPTSLFENADRIEKEIFKTLPI